MNQDYKLLVLGTWEAKDSEGMTVQMIFRMLSADQIHIHINNKTKLRPTSFLMKDDGAEQWTLNRIT